MEYGTGSEDLLEIVFDIEDSIVASNTLKYVDKGVYLVNSERDNLKGSYRMIYEEDLRFVWELY